MSQGQFILIEEGGDLRSSVLESTLLSAQIFEQIRSLCSNCGTLRFGFELAAQWFNEFSLILATMLHSA